MARRVGIAPLYQYFDQRPTNDWFQTITERMNFYVSAASPTTSEVPVSQWLVHKNSNTGELAVWANDNGVLLHTSLTGGGGGGDVVGPLLATNNNVVFFDGVSGKLIKDSGLTLSGSNTGDQTSIVGIGGTKAQYNTSLSDGDFLFVGDVTQYTDEMAQDSVGNMITDTATIALVYNDIIPQLTATVIDASITYAKIQNVSAASKLLGRGDSGSGVVQEITIGSGLSMTGTTLSATGGGTGDVVGPASAVNDRVVFFDGVTGKLIKDSGLTLSGSNTGDQTSIVGITGTKAQFDTAVTDGNFAYQSDLAGYQPLDGDLTSWAGVTRAAGFDTWVATPSSANLRSLMTDETGTGLLYFQGGDIGTPSAGVATNLSGTAASLTAGIANALLVANEATDTTCFLGFYTAASGNLPGKTHANLTFNSNTGVVTFASSILTTTDINGGTIDGTTIGASSHTTGKFTTIETSGNIGLWGAPSASSMLNAGASSQITGAVTSYGMYMGATVQSGVTTEANGFRSALATAAAAFTVTTFSHFVVDQGTKGAGSTITDQYGFQVRGSLTGGTNNFAFHHNLASAAGRWGFYGNGTATNLLNGPLMVNHTLYYRQPAQTSKAAAATLTIAELLTQIIQYTGAAANLTMPTGTLIEGGLATGIANDLAFEFNVINTGTGTATIVTAAGLTLTGAMTVPINTSATFRVRRTAANTYTVYRV
jgi:hypothetical protein